MRERLVRSSVGFGRPSPRDAVRAALVTFAPAWRVVDVQNLGTLLETLSARGEDAAIEGAGEWVQANRDDDVLFGHRFVAVVSDAFEHLPREDVEHDLSVATVVQVVGDVNRLDR